MGWVFFGYICCCCAIAAALSAAAAGRRRFSCGWPSYFLAWLSCPQDVCPYSAARTEISTTIRPLTSLVLLEFFPALLILLRWDFLKLTSAHFFFFFYARFMACVAEINFEIERKETLQGGYIKCNSLECRNFWFTEMFDFIFMASDLGRNTNWFRRLYIYKRVWALFRNRWSVKVG